MGSAFSCYRIPLFKAFSETDFTEDLKKVDIPVPEMLGFLHIQWLQRQLKTGTDRTLPGWRQLAIVTAARTATTPTFQKRYELTGPPDRQLVSPALWMSYLRAVVELNAEVGDAQRHAA